MEQCEWAYQLSKMQESILTNGHIRCRIFDLEEHSAYAIHGTYFVPAVMSAYQNMINNGGTNVFIAVVEANPHYFKLYGKPAVNEDTYDFNNAAVQGADHHPYPLQYMELRFLIGDPNALFVFGRNIRGNLCFGNKLHGEWDMLKGHWCPRTRFETTNVELELNFPNVIEANIPEAKAVPRKDTKVCDAKLKQFAEITESLEFKYKDLLHYSLSYRDAIGCETIITQIYDDFVDTATGLLNHLLVPVYLHGNTGCRSK